MLDAEQIQNTSQQQMTMPSKNPAKAKQTRAKAACNRCAQPARTDHEKQVVQPHKKALLNRLSRIAGQVNGVSQMISKDRYCIDVLYQISAIRAALDAVSTLILSDHANGCVRKAVLEDGGEDAIKELLNVIQKLK